MEPWPLVQAVHELGIAVREHLAELLAIDPGEPAALHFGTNDCAKSFDLRLRLSHPLREASAMIGRPEDNYLRILQPRQARDYLLMVLEHEFVTRHRFLANRVAGERVCRPVRLLEPALIALPVGGGVESIDS